MIDKKHVYIVTHGGVPICVTLSFETALKEYRDLLLYTINMLKYKVWPQSDNGCDIAFASRTQPLLGRHSFARLYKWELGESSTTSQLTESEKEVLASYCEHLFEEWKHTQ